MMTYIADVEKNTFWAHRSWTRFAEIEDKHNHLIVVPVFGFADWGLGHPMDLEEIAGMAILKQAVKTIKGFLSLIVVPPLRFVLGPYQNCAFSLDPETAYDFVEEVVHSIHITGFNKVVFFNTSPWNEEIINKACARDLRIKYAMQMFSINLYGLGLDFHPVRSKSRSQLQTMGTYLLEKEPILSADEGKLVPSDALELGEAAHAPALVDFTPIEQARREGSALLRQTGESLAGLLLEISERPPLPHDGVIYQKKGL